MATAATQRDALFDAAFLARLERLHLMAKRVSGRALAGQRRARRLGDGLEFADHRAYQPGDDVRFIDWAAYARRGALWRRMFHEHSEADVVVLLDVSASMGSSGAGRATGEAEPFTYACRVAMALVYVAATSLERVRIQPFAEDLQAAVDVGRRAEGLAAALDQVASLTPAGRTGLAASVRRFVAARRQPATVLIVSDLLDCEDQLADALAYLRQATCDSSVVHVNSPSEASPRLDGSARLVAAETDRRMDVTVTPQVLAAYRECWRERAEAIRRTCLARQANYVSARTDQPLERLVLQTLRQAGVLAG